VQRRGADQRLERLERRLCQRTPARCRTIQIVKKEPSQLKLTVGFPTQTYLLILNVRLGPSQRAGFRQQTMPLKLGRWLTTLRQRQCRLSLQPQLKLLRALMLHRHQCQRLRPY
jgi:hypothetical protein